MYRLLSKTGAILSAFVLFIFLVACGDSTDSSENGENESDQASNEEETEETITIEHSMGTTEIEGTPEKVVTLYQGATDTITSFGIEPVGIVESWVETPIYEYLRDDLEGTTIVGQETQPNLEEIASLDPDVIFASKTRHEDIYEKLDQIAPTIAIETLYDFKGTVELMGQAFNKQDRADEILNNWNNRVEDFNTKAENELGDKWPQNVALLNFRSDHARIYFDSFAGSILREAGFERPENQQGDEWGIKLTDKESITEMNADVFFVFMGDDPAVEETYNEWTNHPLWENLDAVKNDQVYRVDQVIWNMGGGINAANLMVDELYEHYDLEK
ncbi:ABC-type Fe3+-hydroxamate transport system, periplasmic component [Gracilibacillus halophilus YIM-C55.5]|uniref:ABC-type Fe3+-hydroxamate transport system, periplasmic component n=1 Tax=Gracilibacillus halophilus YIM-C55.5 TaxID=1308866 RepID=N4W8L2_9BACI|nr:iron-siderophore ABC transporter substrate-binding protein [Gracilibacillus halophilus]ENH95544.1 ABC-type Fe3+-hydroxamate transport system, periplasmic component [Gracilibacillus halophilus YIM-C55.5]